MNNLAQMTGNRKAEGPSEHDFLADTAALISSRNG